MLIRLNLIALLTLLVIGCATQAPITNQETEIEINEKPVYLDAAHVIKDIKALTQDSTAYINESCAKQPLILSKVQKQLDKNFNGRFFAPWDMKKSYHSKKAVLASFKRFSRNLGFGETKQKHSKSWINDLIKLANLNTYPNTHRKAITIKNTDLRVLPTSKPHFNDFKLAGEGYPFDNLQHSAIWAHTPIFVSHISRDKSWALVQAAFATGWIPVDDIGFVDKQFIKTWKTGEYIAVVKDQVTVLDADDIFRFKANIGTILPKIGETDKYFEILIAITNENRQAVSRNTTISKQFAISKPLQFSQSNVARLTNQLLSKPYGWGGMYENRDCSSTTKDLFTPFGLWLPRNSASQVKVGKYIPLQHLSQSKKEAMIIKKGVPYLTLLWKKGHIMLYIGKHEDNAIIFHNFWGIKTKNSNGKEGRKIVGKSVITTIRPGNELDNLHPKKGSFLKNIIGMTILVAPSKLKQACR